MDADTERLLFQQKAKAVLVDELISRAEAKELIAQKQKQLARCDLKKLIRLSRWDKLKEIYPDFTPKLTTFQDKEYFDWTCLTPEMSLLFAGCKEITKQPDFALPKQVRMEKGVKATYKQVTVPLSIVEKGIPLRILEGIGDRVVGIASAIIGFDKFKTDRRGFHSLYTHLISNSNLESAGYKSGDAAEIELGCVFVAEGPQAAVEAGVKLLKQTSVYKQVTQ